MAHAQQPPRRQQVVLQNAYESYQRVTRGTGGFSSPVECVKGGVSLEMANVMVFDGGCGLQLGSSV